MVSRVKDGNAVSYGGKKKNAEPGWERKANCAKK